MPRRQTKPTGVCICCGVQPGTTADHVPPKSLYGSSIPNNVITVPCCRTCNQEKRMDDDYLREYLVLEGASRGHPQAEELLLGPLLRASMDPHHKRAPLIHTARWESLLVPRYTNEGEYLGDYAHVLLQSKRIQDELIRITKGLFYKFSGKRLTDDYWIRTDHIEASVAPSQVSALWQAGVRNLYYAGDGDVFCCLYSILAGDEENLGKSIWLMEFYQSVWFLTLTSPVSLLPDFS